MQNIRAIVLTALDFTELIFELVAPRFLWPTVPASAIFHRRLSCVRFGWLFAALGSLRCGGSCEVAAQPTGVSQMPYYFGSFLSGVGETGPGSSPLFRM